MSRKLPAVLIFFTVCTIISTEGGLVKTIKSRHKRTNDKPGTDFNVAQFLFSDNGLLSNLFKTFTDKKPASGDEKTLADSDTDPKHRTKSNQNPSGFNMHIADGLRAFFGKLMQTLDGKHSKNPNIDPFADLDFSQLGLCTRETCGDLYRIVDNFKTSPFYTNLKTLTILLQDKEGINFLTQILSDPQFLKSMFSGGKGGAMSLFGDLTPGNSVNTVERKDKAGSVPTTGVAPTDYHYDYDSLSGHGKGKTVSDAHPKATKTSINDDPKTQPPVDYAALYYDHNGKG